MAGRTLTSKWTGLNPALLAALYPTDNAGKALPDGNTVIALPTESNIELTANWQSPFEQQNLDNARPAISGLSQTGSIEGLSQTLGRGNDGGDSFFGRIRDDFADAATAAGRATAGRTGVTKLNSTQVFTGAAPVKISLTAIFRAFESPADEVQAPIDQLARWVLARSLAANGSIVSAIVNLRDGQGVVKSALPSEAPTMVAFRYGGYTFSPLVIESMSKPLTVPRTSAGEAIAVQVQLVLASLTALDADDWTRARAGLATKLFNN